MILSILIICLSCWWYYQFSSSVLAADDTANSHLLMIPSILIICLSCWWYYQFSKIGIATSLLSKVWKILTETRQVDHSESGTNLGESGIQNLGESGSPVQVYESFLPFLDSMWNLLEWLLKFVIATSRLSNVWQILAETRKVDHLESGRNLSESGIFPSTCGWGCSWCWLSGGCVSCFLGGACNWKPQTLFPWDADSNRLPNSLKRNVMRHGVLHECLTFPQLCVPLPLRSGDPCLPVLLFHLGKWLFRMLDYILQPRDCVVLHFFPCTFGPGCSWCWHSGGCMSQLLGGICNWKPWTFFL
jgi:hypothetical protein